jgi:TonB family protein
MLPLLLAAAVAGTQQAYVVSLFQPPIEIAPNLTYQYWDAGPSIDDLRVVAEQEHRDGEAGLRCSIARSGRLQGCRVVEQLGGARFGSAALRLSRKFLMKPELANRAQAAAANIFVRVPFCVSVVCDPPEWRP